MVGPTTQLTEEIPMEVGTAVINDHNLRYINVGLHHARDYGSSDSSPAASRGCKIPLLYEVSDLRQRPCSDLASPIWFVEWEAVETRRITTNECSIGRQGSYWRRFQLIERPQQWQH
jgi:hypothetical protein